MDAPAGYFGGGANIVKNESCRSLLRAGQGHPGMQFVAMMPGQGRNPNSRVTRNGRFMPVASGGAPGQMQHAMQGARQREGCAQKRNPKPC